MEKIKVIIIFFILTIMESFTQNKNLKIVFVFIFHISLQNNPIFNLSFCSVTSFFIIMLTDGALLKNNNKRRSLSKNTPPPKKKTTSLNY